MASEISKRDAVFCSAIEITSAEERAAYIARACGEDAELKRQVEELVAAHFQAGSFLNQPAGAPVTDAYGSDPAEAPAEAGPAEGREDPGRRIGLYKLLQQIGEGGMGTVWMAEQEQPVRRKVALKIVKPGMDSRQIIARFEAERQALALMDHPNIARVLDAGTTDSGRPFFAMELVKGTPITAYCDEHRLTPRQRLELFVPVCQAIQHAHQKGVIHRDVKPSNVLVAPYDGRPVVKVIDFGVAKAVGQPLTEKTLFTGFGAVVGTLEYMSPEQAELNNQDIDTRSDVYSLGVLLYELLTGTTPLTRQQLKQAAFTEMLRLIREEEPPKPSTRLSESKDSLPSISAQRQTEPAKLAKLVRGELDWIVMKALEKDRGRRYETANGLSMDVQRYLQDENVLACPPSAAYKLRKFVRRNKGPVLTVAVVFLALLGGIAGTTWQAVRAERAREAEAIQREIATQNEARATEAAAQERLAKDHAVAAHKLAAERLVQVESEKKRADQEAKAAREAEADTRAFSTFLVDDVLAVPRPEGIGGGLGIDVTVAQALTAAEKNLDRAFAGRPLAEAEARRAIGVTWRNLGKYTEAERHSRRAIDLFRQQLGDDDTRTLTSRHELGLTLLLAGRGPEAVACLEQVRDALAKKPPANPLDLLFTQTHLAAAYYEVGKLSQAMELSEQLRGALVKKLGADHPRTLQALSILAMAYRETGKWQQAIEILEQLRDIQVKKLGADHPEALTAQTNLASAYLGAGKLAQAIEIYEKTSDATARKFGADHHYTLIDRMMLAVAYRDAGKLNQAIELLEQLRGPAVKNLGADHPSTLNILSALAGAYRKAGKHSQAIELFEQVRDTSVKKRGADHPETLVVLTNLAFSYMEAGKTERALALLRQAAEGLAKLHFKHRGAGLVLNGLGSCHEQLNQYPEAEAWRRKGLAVVKEQSGAESPAYADALTALGANLLRQKKWTDAEPLLRESLALRAKIQPDARTTFSAQAMLGEALLGQKKYAGAEPLLLAGYQGMKARQATIPSQSKARVTEVLERVVQLYDAWGKQDEAARWRKELEAAKPAKKP
jgi:serine/threonine protein kinase/tetratricopeptide (TPR) repeat protein